MLVVPSAGFGNTSVDSGGCTMINVQSKTRFRLCFSVKAGNGSCLEWVVVMVTIESGQIQDMCYNHLYIILLSFDFENCTANFPIHRP